MNRKPSLLIGLVSLALVLAATPAWSAVHIIEVGGSGGLFFSPDELTVNKGDTVRWVWIAGSHTTTSGTGGADPDAGDLWDAPITAANPEFERVFDEVGVFPYYCIPHEFAGMTGTITVQEGTPVERISWGKVKDIFKNTSPEKRHQP